MYLDSSWRIVFPMAMIGYVFDVSVGQGYLKEKKKKKETVGGAREYKVNANLSKLVQP